MNRLPSNYRDMRISHLSRALAIAGVVGFGVLAMPATAQVTPVQPPIPQISVNARGEVQVAPDRARVMVGIETRAKTAAAAAKDASMIGPVCSSLSVTTWTMLLT